MMATLRADSGSPSLLNFMGSGYGMEMVPDTRFYSEWDVPCDAILEDSDTSTLFFNLPNLTTPTFGQVPNSPAPVFADDAESKTQSYDELYSRVKQEKGMQEVNITTANSIPNTSTSTNTALPMQQSTTSPTTPTKPAPITPHTEDRKRKLDLLISIEEDPEVAVYEHKDRRVMDYMHNSITAAQPLTPSQLETPVKTEIPSPTNASKHSETSKKSHRGAYRCGTCGHYPKKEHHDCDEELAQQRRSYRTRKSAVKKAEASTGASKTRGPYKCGDWGYKPKRRLHDCVGRPKQK